LDVIQELGNQLSVGTIRDIPDLQLDLESYDVSPKFEAMLCGLNPGTLSAGQAINFTSAVPLTILSPFRTSQTNFVIINGAIIPALQVQSVAYKFGVNKSDASQTFNLKTDSIYFVPGVPYEDTFTGDGSTSTWTLAHTAVPYFNNTLGVTQYVLNVSVTNADGTFYRLFNGAGFDYTDTSTTLTLNAGVAAPAVGSTIKVAYGSTATQTINQAANNADGVSVKPAALRGRDINIYIGTTAATPTWTRLTGVQSFDTTWTAQNFAATEELGNPNVVSQDYTVPQVTGNVTTRDVNTAALFAKLYATTGVSTSQIVGPLSAVPVPLEIHLNDPSTGARIKTIYIPDAIFDVPEITARVNQLVDTPFKFQSNTGAMTVYNGARPGGVSQA
jgi:hypothetical protein